MVGDVVNTFVNSTNVGALNASGLAVGDLVVIFGRFFSESVIPTFIDDFGNEWEVGSEGFENSSSFCTFWWTILTDDKFSLSFSGAGPFPQIFGAQFAAEGSTWALGHTTPAATVGFRASGDWTSAAFAVRVGDLVLGMWENETTNGITFGDAGGFTWIGASAVGNATMSTKIATGTSETPEINSNNGAAMGVIVASFTPSSAGGGTKSHAFVLG